MVPSDSVWPFNSIYLFNFSLMVSSTVKIVSRCFMETLSLTPDPLLCLTGRNLGQDQAPLWGQVKEEEEKRRCKHHTCKYTCTQAAIAVFKGHHVRGQCFAGCYHFRRTTAGHSLIRFMRLIMGHLLVMGDLLITVTLATHFHEVRKLEDLIKLHPVTA